MFRMDCIWFDNFIVSLQTLVHSSVLLRSILNFMRVSFKRCDWRSCRIFPKGIPSWLLETKLKNNIDKGRC